MRDYGDGNYTNALKEYERLLQKQNEDPRLHFNAGAAAYRNKQFEEATNQFNQALATPDLKLQQQAYFNRGNALFRMGEENSDPKKKTDQWEQSLKDFEIADKLNQKDSDAKFNYDYVKRKLEELKQRQQQQQQQKNDKKDKKDDQQKQDQQKQNQQGQNDDKQKQDQKQDQQGQQNQKDGQQKKDQQGDKKDDQQQASQKNDPSQQKQRSKAEKRPGQGSERQTKAGPGETGRQKRSARRRSTP